MVKYSHYLFSSCLFLGAYAAIAVTLGLPPAMEHWTNEQSLKFMCHMWERRRQEEEKQGPGAIMDRGDTRRVSIPPEGTAASEARAGAAPKPKVGPADPDMVVSAAKAAFATLGENGALLLREKADQCDGGCPLASDDAIMLERTLSGAIRVPKEGGGDEGPPGVLSSDGRNGSAEYISNHLMEESHSGGDGDDDSSTMFSRGCSEHAPDPVKRKSVSEWLGVYLGSLNETAQLPFSDADLWQLHQHFFSPVDVSLSRNEDGSTVDAGSSDMHIPQLSEASYAGDGSFFSESRSSQNALRNAKDFTNPIDSCEYSVAARHHETTRKCGFVRKISYRYLGDAAALTTASNLGFPNSGTQSPNSRRRSAETISRNYSFGSTVQPACKRARSNKPRIAYYPRIRVS